MILRNVWEALANWRKKMSNLVMKVGPVTLKKFAPKGKIKMSLVLTDEQKVTLTVTPRTAAGNVATVDGAPSWTTSNPELFALAPAADGMTCVVTTSGMLGTGQVSASADADMTPGTRNITSVLEIEVKAAEAVQLGIDSGVPEPK